MLGDHQATVRRAGLAEDHVAAPLAVELVADFGERLDCPPPGDLGQTTQPTTSTTSSVMGGGIGSP
jgi:hypothetical protein